MSGAYADFPPQRVEAVVVQLLLPFPLAQSNRVLGLVLFQAAVLFGQAALPFGQVVAAAPQLLLKRGQRRLGPGETGLTFAQRLPVGGGADVQLFQLPAARQQDAGLFGLLDSRGIDLLLPEPQLGFDRRVRLLGLPHLSHSLVQRGAPLLVTTAFLLEQFSLAPQFQAELSGLLRR